MSATPIQELPAYPRTAPSTPRARLRRWPFALLLVLGMALAAGPIASNMFIRTVRADAMLESFQPYVGAENLAQYRHDLAVLDGARSNIVALQAAPGQYPQIDRFVREFPAIRADLEQMINAIDANAGRYQTLSAGPGFGQLPWLLLAAGLILIAAAVAGLRAAAQGRRPKLARVAACATSAGLLLVPAGFGLFQAAPAGGPLIDSLGPIVSQSQVRKVQNYFVVLVAADGELNSRFGREARAAKPHDDFSGIVALEQQWQPMTSRFAGLVGVLNDNVSNFSAVRQLDSATKPMGFRAFGVIGWFFVIPALAGLALSLVPPASTRSS